MPSIVDHLVEKLGHAFVVPDDEAARACGNFCVSWDVSNVNDSEIVGANDFKTDPALSLTVTVGDERGTQ